MLRLLAPFAYLPVLIITALMMTVISTSVSRAEKPLPQADLLSVSNASTILNRYRTILLERPIEELEILRGYIDKLSDEGTWPDLKYQDKRSFGWGPEMHLYRVRAMSHAWVTKKHPLYQDSKLRSAINSAIDNWLANRYQSVNWWHNRIGAPQTMRDILVLLSEDLRGPRRQGVMEVLAQHGTGGTGANLAWQTELAIHECCLNGAEEKLAEPIDQMWKEIKVGAKEAIQSDWTFYQHGKRLHAFSYGRSFVDIVVNLGWQLRGTPWEMPEQKRAIVSNYLLEGLQWMSRGTYTPPSTIDRVISRKHGKTAADLRMTLRRWSEVDSIRRKELETFLAHQEGSSERPLGHRHFPKGDFTTYHRPTGSIFLKTISSRTKPTETMGGENRKGTPYLHSGDHYIVRDGQEYAETQPVWKWSRLPGLTVTNKSSRQTRKDFVGGVGNGKSGLTVMDYQRTSKGNPAIHVRKAWFFHGDLMINLMGDWNTSDNDQEIVTSLEQCRLRGPVEVGEVEVGKASDESKHRTLPQGKHSLEKTIWVMHRDIGYFPLEPSKLNISLGPQTGSWSSINRRYNDRPNCIRIPMFRLQIPHASEKPISGYAIMLDATQEKLDTITRNPTWQILQNNGQCQAIRFENGFAMAAFYQPGVVGEEAASLEVDQPCLAMWNDETLWLCDPTNAGLAVNVHWKTRHFEVTLQPEGVTLKTLSQ